MTREQLLMIFQAIHADKMALRVEHRVISVTQDRNLQPTSVEALEKKHESNIRVQPSR
jgi:hypothetical protein